jgi:hypothetical protein
VWGGFGSQLFALIIAERLQIKTRLRRIKIIFHSSGVTERKLEIPEIWLEQFKVEMRDDFRDRSLDQGRRDRESINSKIRKKFKNLLLTSGLAAASNSEKDFSGLKPWVVSIRGHYTEIQLKESEIRSLMDKFELSADAPRLREVAIHYRLGDLLKLEEKGFIHPQRIIETWKSQMMNNLPVHIFSDSTSDDLKKIWQEADCPKVFEFSNLSPIRTIQSCFNAEEFLGTNAKLSLWITLFRLAASRDSTFIPIEIRNQFNALSCKLISEFKIKVY